MMMYQYRKGNNAANFLAREREKGKNETYDGHYCLPRLLKGIIRVDILVLPSFRK